MKWDVGQVTIRNAYVHDNDCKGLWADINAHGALIEHNLVEHNLAGGDPLRDQPGRRHPQQPGLPQRLRRAGWYWDGGITVASSFNVEVYGNRLSGNYNGITGTQQDRPDSTPPAHLLDHYQVHDNLICATGDGGTPPASRPTTAPTSPPATSASPATPSSRPPASSCRRPAEGVLGDRPSGSSWVWLVLHIAASYGRVNALALTKKARGEGGEGREERDRGDPKNKQPTILVTGAGGFIGHHLTRYLVDKGYSVRGVDVKPPEYEPSPADDFRVLDLRRWESCLEATREWTTSTTWPPTWAGSGSSRPTRP